ncbi:FAD-dependent oxidoreductase [Nakamurella sp. GG22]
MSPRFDVVVVGARVAGAATALLLARAGLRVLCVDRSRYGSDTLSTHALMRGGVTQLERWGLLPALEAAGTPAVRRTVFHYGDESYAVSIRPSGGVDALFAPRRTVIDTLLVDAAARAGVTFRFGVTVADLHRSDDAAVRGVVLADKRSGRSHVEEAELVVGADGRASTVAERAGSGIESAGSHASSFLYGYWADFPTDGYEWFYRPGLTAGAIPTNDGLTCVFIGGRPARLAPLVRATGPGAAFSRLAQAAGLRSRMRSAGRFGPVRHVHGLPANYLRTAAGGGWALVGDAGHWLDPMSTHGMTAALRDAELLARAVASSTGDERPDALAAYQAERDRLSRPMMAVTEEIASYDWDLSEIRGLLRGLASAMTEEVEALAGLDAPA